MKINEITGLYENYGLWHIPFWQTIVFRTKLLVMGSICILFIILLSLYFYIRHRGKRKLSPQEQALHNLHQLKSQGKVTIEASNEFYGELTHIVKKYLHEYYNYDVIGKTDAEMMIYLQKLDHDETSGSHIIMLTELCRLINNSETIKFAYAKAAKEQINQDYECVITLIKQAIKEKKN